MIYDLSNIYSERNETSGLRNLEMQPLKTCLNSKDHEKRSRAGKGWLYYILLHPRYSMYGIFTHIWVIFAVNVGKYSIHGASGYCIPFPAAHSCNITHFGGEYQGCFAWYPLMKYIDISRKGVNTMKMAHDLFGRTLV